MRQLALQSLSFKNIFIALVTALVGQLVISIVKSQYSALDVFPKAIESRQVIEIPAGFVVYHMVFGRKFLVHMSESQEEINEAAERFLRDAKGIQAASVSRTFASEPVMGSSGVAMGASYEVGITMTYNTPSDFYHDLNVAQRNGLIAGYPIRLALTDGEQKKAYAEMDDANLVVIARHVKMYEGQLRLRQLPMSNCSGFGFGSGVSAGGSALSGGLTATEASFASQDVGRKLPSASKFLVPISRLVLPSNDRAKTNIDIKKLDLWPTVKVERKTEKIICFGNASMDL